MKKIVIIAALVCGAWQQADAQYVSKVWVPDQKDGTYINPIIHADYLLSVTTTVSFLSIGEIPIGVFSW